MIHFYRQSSIVRLGLIATAFVTLSGCASSHGYALLDRAPEARDEIAATLPDHAYDELDAETARWAGEHDGVSIYLGRGKTAGICALAYAHEDAWVVSCGSVAGVNFFGQSVGSYVVRPDGSVQPEGTTAISENVYVRD